MPRHDEWLKDQPLQHPRVQQLARKSRSKPLALPPVDSAESASQASTVVSQRPSSSKHSDRSYRNRPSHDDGRGQSHCSSGEPEQKSSRSRRGYDNDSTVSRTSSHASSSSDRSHVSSAQRMIELNPEQGVSQSQALEKYKGKTASDTSSRHGHASNKNSSGKYIEDKPSKKAHHTPGSAILDVVKYANGPVVHSNSKSSSGGSSVTASQVSTSRSSTSTRVRSSTTSTSRTTTQSSRVRAPRYDDSRALSGSTASSVRSSHGRRGDSTVASSVGPGSSISQASVSTARTSGSRRGNEVVRHDGRSSGGASESGKGGSSQAPTEVINNYYITNPPAPVATAPPPPPVVMPPYYGPSYGPYWHGPSHVIPDFYRRGRCAQCGFHLLHSDWILTHTHSFCSDCWL